MPQAQLPPAHSSQIFAELELHPQQSRGVGKVVRVAKDVSVDSSIDENLQPLAQILAASRSMALARLAALRLMGASRPMRSSLTHTTVDWAHRTLFAEEEIAEAVVSQTKPNTGSGALYCSLHSRLDLLQRIEADSSREIRSIDRRSILISELIQDIHSGASVLQNALQRASGKPVDMARMLDIFRSAMDESTLTESTT